MSKHEYTAVQALDTLMDRLRKRDEQLAEEVQAAIDAGKDVTKFEPGLSGDRKRRTYRRVEPFTPEEALRVAVAALQALFVEQPLFVNSLSDSMRAAALGGGPRVRNEPGSEVAKSGTGEPKSVEIELQPETWVLKSERETFQLVTVETTQIEEQRRNLDRLRELADFSEDNDGDTSRS